MGAEYNAAMMQQQMQYAAPAQQAYAYPQQTPPFPQEPVYQNAALPTASSMLAYPAAGTGAQADSSVAAAAAAYAPAVAASKVASKKKVSKKKKKSGCC